LGAAVRSFFAQGGARCFVVRVGDAWPFDKPREPEELAFAADTRLARLRQLVPGYAGGDAGSPANREVWRGLEVLHSLEEAAFVCLPDLPELVADATLGPVGLRELPPGPEEFTKYSPVVAPLTDEIRRFSRSPACTESGYGEWFKVANQAAAFLNSWRKDVELILAVPLPAKGIVSQGDLLRVLHQKDRPGLATRTKDGALGGIATAFLQLVYPWLGTDSAALLPGELEPPDGAFAGIAARTAAKLGAHRSLGRQPLHRVSRFFPPLSARDQQLITSKGEAPALIHRVSLLGQTPDGPRVLSDVTTSLDAAHRPASVGRLTAAILRTARRLGQEVTFDNSGSELWRAIERRLDSLLGQFFSAGALLGDNPAAAFSVTCDETTTTQNDLDNGRVFAVVRFAPAQPVGVITVVLALRDGAPLTAETQD
ncbi:MAG TPA: phage tail sheath protein, partial [Verrucomicrobiae bacterium]